ncbi:hypothetical protein CSOJ01_02557 [Colletotrichum sojae]|uniref:Uncharacterized protein n=1 Tax=Colletotrichum sojae TaxID=2175907 RepID=A0A8H6JPU8_9PEZI|nr:hypothetical protein CSOJ01_02557 [Colletotrichum sojae]
MKPPKATMPPNQRQRRGISEQPHESPDRDRDRESRRQRRGGGDDGDDGGGGRGGDGDRPFTCKGSPSPSTPPATTPAIQLVSDGRWWPTAVVVPVPAYLTVTPPPRVSSQHHNHHQSTTTTSPNPARGLATSALWAGFHPHSGWPKPPPGLTPGLVPVGRRPDSKLTGPTLHLERNDETLK